MKILMSCVLTALITAIVCATIFGAANQLQEERVSKSLDSISIYRKAYFKCNTKRKLDNKFFNDTVK